jgi:hypothetical protein
MRADKGSKILAAREQVDPASTLRNLSLTWDTASTSHVACVKSCCLPLGKGEIKRG